MLSTPKIKPPAMTTKQIEILKALIQRNPDGSMLDVYQLLAVIPGASRAAMICSLRHMAGHHLVIENGRETRRGRSMMTYAPSTAGFVVMRGSI